MPILLTLLLVPFVAAVVLLFVPERRQPAIRVIATVTGVLLFALSILAFATYNHVQGGFQLEEQYT